MKKKFMGAFALIASSFVTQQAVANTVQPSEPTASQNVSAVVAAASELISVKNNDGDIFNFVLKRSSETGQLMAWHESHASHASHSSHSSHYSSRY
jgi:hypothetical protein